MNYLIKRESTRVIVIAPGSVPGNATLSYLFSLGVWDIISPDITADEVSIYSELKECLSRDKSYAKGVKWFIGTSDLYSANTVMKEVKVIKEVPKYVTVNFTNKIFTVWGNAQFACEFAYYTALNTQYNVLLVDLDFTALYTDIYLGLYEQFQSGIEHNISFTNLLESVKDGDVSKDIILSGSTQVVNKLNLIASEYIHINYAKFQNYPIENLIDAAHRHFDILIINVNSSINDPFTIQALESSQINLVPIKANVATVNKYMRYIEVLDGNNNIPLDKHKVIAYCYKNGVDMDIGMIRRIFDTCYLNKISYSDAREIKYGKGDIYSNAMTDINRHEYNTVLNMLGIAIKPTFLDKLKMRFARYITNMEVNNEVTKK